MTKTRYTTLILLAALVGAASCNVRRKDKVADDISKQIETALKEPTTIQLIDSVYDFGKVVDGDKVEFNFRFRNTGTKPLIVTKTTASCGCTVPEKPERPVMPGEINYIKVVFNSRGKIGHNEKTIEVISNAKPPFPELVLKGNVEMKNTEQ